MRPGIKIAAGALTLVASVALATPASAGQGFPTEVTIEFAPGKRVDAFTGEVSSPRPACALKRKVILYKRKNQHSKPIKVGADKIDNDAGVWAVEASPEEDFYFARVKAREIGAGLCKQARSLTLLF